MASGKYTVNEVEERAKVAASTLRQWERRYGFPKPERTESGYRLYSDEDLRQIEAMKQHIAEGIPASRAAELVKNLTPAPSGPRSLADLQRELIEALIALDEVQADRILSEAHALHPVEAVMLELLQASMVEIGRLWHHGKVSTATEHFASSYVQGRLRSLLSITAHIRNAPAVIVACAPGEQHELGALVLAVMLRRAGYRLYFLGANTPLADLREMARHIKATGVMISASSSEAVQRLMEERGQLTGMAPVLAFGGLAFNERPELAKALGGLYLASSADQAVEHFHELVQAQGAMQA